MSARNPRRPAAFRLDDPQVVVVSPDEPRPTGRASVLVTPEPEKASVPVIVAPPARRRRLPWGTVFWSASGGLVTLGFGLAVTRLIEDLFARSEALGYVALSLASAAAIGLSAFVIREIAGLARLNAVERLRARRGGDRRGRPRDGARRRARAFSGGESRAAARPRPH